VKNQKLSRSTKTKDKFALGENDIINRSGCRDGKGLDFFGLLFLNSIRRTRGKGFNRANANDSIEACILRRTDVSFCKLDPGSLV